MKNLLLALTAAIPLLATADEPGDVTQKEPATIESQLKDLESGIGAYESVLPDFEKGVASYGSDLRMQRISCGGIRAALTNTLQRLEARAAALKKQRSQMTEAELARFSESEQRLAKASPSVPSCAGK